MGLLRWFIVKESACQGGDAGLIPESEWSLEKGMGTHSSILAWKIHGQRSLVGYSPQVHKDSDRTKQQQLSLPYLSLTLLNLSLQHKWYSKCFPLSLSQRYRPSVLSVQFFHATNPRHPKKELAHFQVQSLSWVKYLSLSNLHLKLSLNYLNSFFGPKFFLPFLLTSPLL